MEKLLKHLLNVIASVITTRAMYLITCEFMNNYAPEHIGILAGWLVLVSIDIVFFVMVFVNFVALLNKEE